MFQTSADCRAVGPARTAIEVTEVFKSYRRSSISTPVLQNVTLSIRCGDCVFLVGPSGSGKTTLLSILGCILTPDEGEVRLFGEDITAISDMRRAEIRRDRIGFVFQRFHLVRGLNALENVTIPLRLQGHSPRVANRRASELLEAVGLANSLNATPSKMSTGQCQRIALARALAADPDIILADEPTASLDETSGRSAMEVLHRTVRESNKTLVVVTHDPRIYGYADRICHMRDGRIVEQTKPVCTTATRRVVTSQSHVDSNAEIVTTSG